MIRPRASLLAVLFLWVSLSSRADAAFDEQDRQLAWASDAASASAFSATRQGLQATVYNPAALGFAEDAWLGLSGGNGGLEADWVGQAAMLWPAQDDLSVGLAYREMDGGGGPGFSEKSLGLSASLEPTYGFTLGLRPWLHQASSAVANGGVSGFSLDAGVLWRLNMARDWDAQLAWWGAQLASEWPDRFWRRAVPVTQHGGLAITWRNRADLGLGVEQAALAGSSPEPVLRAGLTVTRFKRWRPSLGASTEPRAQFSAGVEVPLRYRGNDIELAYALMLGNPDQGLRHRLQLSFGFQVRHRGQIVAVPLQVVYEPGTKKVKSATVSLNVAANADVQEWELEIRDKSGRVVRVLRGTGTPPAFVTWDGKDALGEAMQDSDGVSYRLNIKTASGLRSSAPSYAVDAHVQDSGLELLQTQSESLVVPVLDADGKVTQLRLRPPAVPGQTQRWQIQIQDSTGKTLRTLDGVGPFPTQLLWDGKDEAGHNALSQAGLRVRFNAWDDKGQINSTDQNLDSGLQPLEEDEVALPRLGLKIPAFREGGPAPALVLSDSSLKPLPVEAASKPTLAPTRVPKPISTATPTQIRTARPTAIPTAVPTPIPTVVDTPVPTELPTLLPTAVPTQVPTTEATEAPTAIPTPIPTTVARGASGLGAGLVRSNYLPSADLIPPTYMTREQAEGPSARPRRRVSSGHTRLPAAINGLLDVFLPDSADVDPAKADKLQAFFWRLGAFKQRRIQLTGLVGNGEVGGEVLSRQRVRELSRLMVEEGDFNGEFILKVEGQSGPEKGVRVEVLRR